MIRNAAIKDLPGIVDLWFEMSTLHDELDESFRLRSNAKDIFQKYAQSVLEDESKLSIVYETEDGEVVGYMFAEVIEQPPVYELEKIGFIGEVSVALDYRREGVGKLLLERTKEWFLNQGITRIDCHVAVKNSISQGFWKKNGFVEYMETCSKIILTE